MASKPKPTDDEILAITGSVPVEMAARYLGIPKDIIYSGLKTQAFSFGIACKGEKEWRYDIRPKALVEYQHHGGFQQYKAFENHIIALIQSSMKGA